MTGLIADEGSVWLWKCSAAIIAVLATAILRIMSVKKLKNKFSVRPKMTIKGRAINFLLWPYQRFQLRDEFRPLCLKVMKQEAIDKVGYNDFGSDKYECLYEETLSLVNACNYTPIGQIAVGQFFKRCLITKLRINKEISQNPSIQEYIQANPLRKPIFILGMPRTGTTYLHILLSLDPVAMSAKMWELMDPVPRLRNDLKKDGMKREKFCKTNLDFMLSIIPHFLDVHEVSTTIPEECQLSMNVDVPLAFETYHTLFDNMDVPLSWKGSPDAYQNYTRVLQLLLYYTQEKHGESEKRRCVLKSPLHMGGIPFVSEVFPDARIVWTHREMKNVISSFSAMIRAFNDFSNGNNIELDEIGQKCLKYAEFMMRRGDEFFSSEASTKHQHAHIRYDDLIRDPIGTVQMLYKEFGFEFTDEYHCILESYIQKNKVERELHKRKKKSDRMHHHSLEQFGLTEEMVEEQLGWYTRKYLPRAVNDK